MLRAIAPNYIQSLFHLQTNMDFRCCNKSHETTILSSCINRPSPVDSILDAVFTVSPNRQYRGIFEPTMPATTGPVCAPDRICNRSVLRCGILNWVEPASRSSAMLAISNTCLLPEISNFMIEFLFRNFRRSLGHLHY